ncbi:hypothetical protein MW887_010343 [Aspergillus wentii]|nr:hypothetical protein MW887_010343 [Aspergillus wentii]
MAASNGGKDFIIKHMNADHQDSLVLYLRVYSQISAREAKSARLEDISLSDLVISANGTRYSVPVDPPMKTFSDARSRVVAMHKECLQKLGISDIIIKEYRAPRGAGAVTFAICLAILLGYPRQTDFQPGSILYDTIGLANIPSVAEFLYSFQPLLFPLVLGAHLLETTLFAFLRLKPHGVTFLSGVCRRQALNSTTTQRPLPAALLVKGRRIRVIIRKHGYLTRLPPQALGHRCEAVFLPQEEVWNKSNFASRVCERVKGVQSFLRVFYYYRAFEKGRQTSNTRIGTKRIHLVRTRGGNQKFRALRLESGNFSWGSEGISRKTRVIVVAYHPSNNELVRTNTLTKSAVVQIDAAPFRQWYEAHYGQPIGRRRQQKTDAPEEKKSNSVVKKQAARFADHGKVEGSIERQFESGRLYAVIASRPGQSGRVDGYILEGDELAFYQKAIRK